jgi:hypothetical protein
MTRARKSGARSVPAKPQVLQECRLKVLGGLQSDPFNNLVANQALNSLWTGNADPDSKSPASTGRRSAPGCGRTTGATRRARPFA